MKWKAVGVLCIQCCRKIHRSRQTRAEEHWRCFILFFSFSMSLSGNISICCFHCSICYCIEWVLQNEYFSKMRYERCHWGNKYWFCRLHNFNIQFITSSTQERKKEKRKAIVIVVELKEKAITMQYFSEKLGRFFESHVANIQSHCENPKHFRIKKFIWIIYAFQR